MKKADDKKRVFVNTAFVMISTGFDKFSLVIINMIVCRYLAPDKFGAYTTALTLATFFSTFVDIGTNLSLVRAVSIEKGKRAQNIANAFLTKTVLSVVVYGILLAVLAFVYPYKGDIVWLTVIFGLVRIGNEFMNTHYAVFYADLKFKWSSLTNSVFSMLFLMATALVVALGGGYYGLALSRLAIVIGFIVFLTVVLLSKDTLVFEWDSFRRFIPGIFNFGISTIFSNLYQRFSGLIIPLIYAPLYLGYFMNANYVFSALFMIPDSFAKVLVPYLYRFSYERDRSKFQFSYDLFTKVLSIISVYIAVIFFIFADSIISLVYGSAYLPAAGTLRILGLAVPFVFSMSGALITAADFQRYRTIFQGCAMALNVGFNVALIEKYGIEGAAVSTVATYFSMQIMYNGFLVKKGIVKIKGLVFIYMRLVPVAAASCLTALYLMKGRGFAVSASATTVVYGFMVMVFMIRKKDVVLLRNLFRKGSDPRDFDDGHIASGE